MFNVTVRENSRLVDKIEFDEQNITHYHGRLAMIHRDVMQSCRSNGIWYRVAHAAGIVAERGALLNGMEAMTKEAIQRLRERLETGWQPKADEIDMAVPQVDALNWEWNFEDSGITYQTIDRQPRKTGPVIHIDEHMTHALTDDGFFWLYGSDESEKVRFLGG
jgi:chemotaxis regulatin CheY-phosphate phosphatase CheZ